jgi:hypothetical protein
MRPPRQVPRVRILLPILLTIVGVVLTVIFVSAVLTRRPDGEARPAILFWLGPDGPALFQLGGPSLDTCKSFANWWRTAQVAYLGELAIALAAILLWIDVRHARQVRAVRAAESASTGLVGEETPQ